MNSFINRPSLWHAVKSFNWTKSNYLSRFLLLSDKMPRSSKPTNLRADAEMGGQFIYPMLYCQSWVAFYLLWFALPIVHLHYWIATLITMTWHAFLQCLNPSILKLAIDVISTLKKRFFSTNWKMLNESYFYWKSFSKAE